MSTSTLLKSIFLSVFLMSTVLVNAQKGPKAASDVVIFGQSITPGQLQETGGIVKCATTEYEAMLQAKDPNRLSDSEFEAWLNPLIAKALANKSQNNGIITIPVVVHVIHNGQSVGFQANIGDNQVISQITAMNNDFRKIPFTRGDNTHPSGADVLIQFALAKVDPNGNPTNGIDRVNLCAASWSADEVDEKVKPQTIWDPTQYLNMWTVNFTGSGLLGYAQFPSSSGLPGMPGNGGAANTDGVVSTYRAFGSADYNDGSFNLMAGSNYGRTMTHEVGHFLGLRHLWGDGGCNVDDFCADTPVTSSAGGAQYVCNESQDSCPTSPGFDMVRNYMNYTPDECMNIFTNDQKARMAAVMNNSPRRVTLKTSTADLPIPLFPNDAEVKIENICGGGCSVVVSSFKVTLYNRGTSNLTSAVINYAFNNGTPQTYNWSGSLAQDKFSTITITLPPNTALNDLTASVLSANGSADQRASNNTATKSFGAPAYALSDVVFRLQQDVYGDETTWDLKNSSGTILHSGGPYQDTSANFPTLPGLISQTWTLPVNECYTFTINDAWGDGINSGSGNGFFDLKSPDGTVIIYSGGTFASQDKVSFRLVSQMATAETAANNFDVYPIPVTDILNVTKVTGRAKYTIYNAVGQLVDSGLVKGNKVNVSNLVTGTYLISIKDKEFSGTVKFIKK